MGGLLFAPSLSSLLLAAGCMPWYEWRDEYALVESKYIVGRCNSQVSSDIKCWVGNSIKQTTTGISFGAKVVPFPIPKSTFILSNPLQMSHKLTNIKYSQLSRLLFPQIQTNRPLLLQDPQTKWQPPRRGGVNAVPRSRPTQSSSVPPMAWCSSTPSWAPCPVPRASAAYHGPRHSARPVRCWRTACPTSTSTPSPRSGTWTSRTAPPPSCVAIPTCPHPTSVHVHAAKVNRQGSATTTLRWSTTPSWERKWLCLFLAKEAKRVIVVSIWGYNRARHWFLVRRTFPVVDD